MALLSILGFVLFVLITYALCPFLIWRSFLNISKNVILSRDLDFPVRSKLLWHLAKELLVLPLLTWAWWLDELFCPRFRRTALRNPVFIMSQPRSGTTLMLRTLSVDEDSFFSLKHLEWRYPFLVFWKAIDGLGLRRHIESCSYWPDTELGRLASQIHFHQLGSVEEHGIFFEERMYHHYFSFRRFPLPDVLRRVTDINGLTDGERKKLIRTFTKVVQKVACYRGNGRIWLTKENESVDLYRLLHRAFPAARFLVITREPSAFVSSYITMSNTCTTAKHGIDANTIPGWFEANLAFRREQCEKQAAFCRELDADGAITYVGFAQFTTDMSGSIKRIYHDLGIAMSAGYAAYLRGLQRQQDHRVPGYTNPLCDTAGFETFSAFVRRVSSPAAAFKTG
jgi:omega-hydroxy-beta-dihydromenaquinone-9 sulfotransferase